MLLVERSSETGRFRHLSNHVFRVRNFKNTKALRVIFLLKIFKIEARLQKWSKKIEIKFFDSEIIACELVSLNCLY